MALGPPLNSIQERAALESVSRVNSRGPCLIMAGPCRVEAQMCAAQDLRRRLAVLQQPFAL